MPTNRKREDGTSHENDKLVRVRLPLWRKLSYLKLLYSLDSIDEVILKLLTLFIDADGVQIPDLEEHL